MKKFILLVITLALFSKLSKAEVTNLGDNNVINVEASASGSIHLSAGEIFNQLGAYSYVPLKADYKLKIHYYSGFGAIGAGLSGDLTSDDKNNSPKRLDFDFDAGLAILNSNGQVVALIGNIGLRQNTTSQTNGNLFTDGNLTKAETLDGLKYGGKIQVVLSLVNGEVSFMLLPYLKQWEIEVAAEVNLARIFSRYEIDFAMADLAKIEFSHRTPYDNNNFSYLVGYVRVLLEKQIIPISGGPGGNGVYFDYGIETGWDSRKKAPSITIFIGGRIKL